MNQNSALKLQKSVAAVSIKHQSPLLVRWPTELAGACQPPLFQAGRLNTWAFPSGACQIMCNAERLCCSPISKTRPFLSGSLRSESTTLQPWAARLQNGALSGALLWKQQMLAFERLSHLLHLTARQHLQICCLEAFLFQMLV